MASAALAVSGFDNTNGTVYTTPTWSYNNAKTYVLFTAATFATNDPGKPVITGDVPFTEITGLFIDAAVDVRLYAWVCPRNLQGISISGTTTMTYPATAGRAAWCILELSDVDPTYAQAVTGQQAVGNTNYTLNLAALRAATSIVLAMHTQSGNASFTQESGASVHANTGTGEALGFICQSEVGDASIDAAYANTSVVIAAVGLEFANARSMVSSSTWTLGVGSILQKMKNMVSSSTWVMNIGTILAAIHYFLHPTEPGAQTLDAAGPDSLTLTTESQHSETLNPASPDTQPS